MIFENSILISGRVINSFDMWPERSNGATVISFVGCSHNCDKCDARSNMRNKSLIAQSCTMGKTSVLSYYPGAKIIPDFYKFDCTEKGLSLFIYFIDEICKVNTNRIIFSGGDPLYIDNLKFVKDYLLQKNRPRICIYTGYSIEDVKLMDVEGAEFIKCGKYDYEKSQDKMKYDNVLKLSSTNQNFYNQHCKPISKNGILTF